MMFSAYVRNAAHPHVERFSAEHFGWIVLAAGLFSLSMGCVVGTITARPESHEASRRTPPPCPVFKPKADTAYICHTDETGCMGCYTTVQFEAMYEEDISPPETADHQLLFFTPKPHVENL